jgi:hypothetical protein
VKSLGAGVTIAGNTVQAPQARDESSGILNPDAFRWSTFLAIGESHPEMELQTRQASPYDEPARP